ncbi:beta-glucosidase [Microlunatus endophyticus]|uniref:Beta-glucosidase n=1 Tax=Microlunatus endophyticus TaxID=1716077 RepID=A0A917W7N6_9ACTN|nr:glycoside hydrolase family 3 N-terminal domain-containing protein [Microlunatus endophyticus]GGL80394.1 beta-glucosidase [Microlunatus endophyticus]
MINSPQAGTEPYRDNTLGIEARVDDLLGRLTLREKIGQLNQRPLGWQLWQRRGPEVTLTETLDAELDRFGGLGAIYGLLRADAWSGRDWTTGADPALSAEITAMVQEQVVASSRLGIPALIVEEAPHGHQALGGTLLPTNLGSAATWRPDLLAEAFAHVGRELRARGAHIALASGLDLLRDPRWGRSEECFGEDPLLASRFTAAQVRGLRSEPGIGVVLKHFAGQGAAVGGRNGAGAPIGPRELDELHLPAVRAGIDAGAVGVMAAYNEIDGIPCVANEWLLTGLLRDQWGFGGIVMADLGAIDQLGRTTSSAVETAAVALRAGVDLSLCDEAYLSLEEAVGAGLIDEALIDRACMRVLRVKIELGLLDPPAPLPVFPTPRSADDLVAATPVLLINDDRLLPLGAPGRIAVIGPNADDRDCLLGDYVPPLPDGAGTTVLAGLRDRIGAGRIRHEAGSRLTEPLPGGLDCAVAAAEDSDLVIMVLGGSSVRHYADAFADNGAAELTGAVAATGGEGVDVAEVALPAAQQQLVEAVAATGTPIISVMIAGRPLGLQGVVDHSRALLWAGYPGPDGGRLVAELIMGDREPVGRLPVSLPRTSASLPVAYNERLGASRRYADSESSALFRFGSGLGYTTWSLGVPRNTGGPDLAGAVVSADLTNHSGREGRQIVQLYGRSRTPGLLPRRAVLLGFTAVALAAGATAEVDLRIDPYAIAALGLDAPSTGSAPAPTVVLWPSLDGPGEPPESAITMQG